MKNSRDLILGEVVYTSIIYCIPGCWLFSLNGTIFSFDHMTGENQELGGRKPVETSGVYFGYLKMFLLLVKRENIRIGTSLDK